MEGKELPMNSEWVFQSLTGKKIKIMNCRTTFSFWYPKFKKIRLKFEQMAKYWMQWCFNHMIRLPVSGQKCPQCTQYLQIFIQIDDNYFQNCIGILAENRHRTFGAFEHLNGLSSPMNWARIIRAYLASNWTNNFAEMLLKLMSRNHWNVAKPNLFERNVLVCIFICIWLPPGNGSFNLMLESVLSVTVDMIFASTYDNEFALFKALLCNFYLLPPMVVVHNRQNL